MRSVFGPWPIRVVAALAFVMLLPQGAAQAQAPGHIVRYAVIVGSNSTTGTNLPKLRRLEQDVGEIQRALHEQGGFASERILTLLTPHREELADALTRIEAMRRSRPEAQSLFAFFFTGHAAKGAMLLADGQVDGPWLQEQLARVKADFTLGVVDTCYAAGLGLKGAETLSAMAANTSSTFSTLPKRRLGARGHLWFMSSADDEYSFEDEEIGSVFTHFFVKGMVVGMNGSKRAAVGLTVLDVFHYARSETLSYTRERGAEQTPSLVADFRGDDFPVFSIPQGPTVDFVFEEGVEGHFLLSWNDGAITVDVNKVKGAEQLVKVYPGMMEVTLLQDAKPVASISREVTHNASLSYSASPVRTLPVGQVQQLSRKGDLYVASIEAGTTWAMGAGYELAPMMDDASAPEHRAVVSVRGDHGPGAWRIEVGYGYLGRSFDAWSFDMDAASLRLGGGYAWDLQPLRLSVGPVIGGALTWQRFARGPARRAEVLELGAALRLAWLATDALDAEVAALGGARFAPTIARTSDATWSPWAGASLTLHWIVR